MISNYVLRAKVDSLKKQKDALSLKKKELQNALTACGVSKNQVYKLHTKGKSSLPEGTILNRQLLLNEVKKVEDEFLVINGKLRECYSQDSADRNNSLLEVFKEVFTQNQIIEIKEEAQRRMEGQPPMKVSFSVKDAIESKDRFDKLRVTAKEQLEKMIEFRLLLTGMIEEGCHKFGEAEFLKFISPLNRLIIPIQELEKIKRQHLL